MKHKYHCHKRHVNEVCENNECEVFNYVWRHPKICKYFREYRKYEFNLCLYLHVENDTEIDTLKKQHEELLKNIQQIEKDLKEVDAKILNIEDIHKLEDVEKNIKRFNVMEKKLCDPEYVILNLGYSITDLEANLRIWVENFKMLRKFRWH